MSGTVCWRTASHLVLQDALERGRTARESSDSGGDTGGFDADRDGGRSARFRDQHEGVAAGQAAELPELVPHDQHDAGSDASLPQVSERPPRGVGLVGQSYLHVLRITRHLDVEEPDIPGGRSGDLDHVPERRDAGSLESRFDRCHEIGDEGLRRVGPCRQRDEVDLSPVQPLSDDLCVKPARTKTLDRQRCCGRQKPILLRRRISPVDKMRTRSVHGEHFRATIQAQVQLPRSVRARLKLTVDVVKVRPAHDDEIDAGCAQGFGDRPQIGRVGPAIRDGGAVPVEHDRLEALIEVDRRGSVALVHWACMHAIRSGRRHPIERSPDGLDPGEWARLDLAPACSGRGRSDPASRAVA